MNEELKDMAHGWYPCGRSSKLMLSLYLLIM